MSSVKEFEASEAAEEAGRVDLLDLALILSRQRRLMFTIIVAMTLSSVVVSLILRPTYTANVRLLPPPQPASAGLFAAGGLLGMAAQDLGLQSPNDQYLAMLQSRTVADSIIQKHDLRNVYGVRTMVDARLELDDRTEIVSSKEGAISVLVEDHDAVRAAAIANSYADELKSVAQALSSGEASERKQFFEKQLRSTTEELKNAELQMKSTQENSGLVHLDGETRAIIEGIARLQGQVAAQEILLKSLRISRTESNPDVVRAEEELRGLRAQLANLQGRQQNAQLGLPGLRNVPAAGLEYVRSLRSVKYYETIFELLARQYELARIDEAKAASGLQILDRAVVPDKRSGPKRTLMVVVGFTASLLIAVMVAFAVDGYSRFRLNPYHAARLQVLRSTLASK